MRRRKKQKNYAIAYTTRAYYETHPRVYDEILNRKQGLQHLREMQNDVLIERVTLFEYEGDLPKPLTWLYVSKHKVAD